MGAVGARRWAFAGALGAFHASELAFAATCTPHDFGPHSLLLSPQYLASMSLAVAEDALWSWAAPGLKRPRPAAEAAAGLGLVMVVLGEVLRKGALLSARGNFTHTMQQTRRQGHVLVSDGVYRHFRHPGYLGWWVWVVGTQVLMLNPLCSVLFFVMCRRFFSVRVHVEEALLRLRGVRGPHTPLDALGRRGGGWGALVGGRGGERSELAICLQRERERERERERASRNRCYTGLNVSRGG